MAQIPHIFRGSVAQLMHVVILPVFFFAFTLLHRSLGIDDLLGREWFGVRVTIISCILFGSILITRLTYYYLPFGFNYSLYIFWCFFEVLFASFFVALYIWLVLDKPMPYFESVAVSFRFLFMTLIFAYIILGLSLRVFDYHERSANPGDYSSHKMRFYDNLHNLKIVLSPQSILYISADENYVKIYYLENGHVREFVLRASMKSLDELCLDNGLARCHRSFYINPAHVKVLRRGKDGIMYAELDSDDTRHIPVSKSYYRRLTDML